MKGIIFNVVENAVTALHGASAWDDILDHSGLDGSYTALGTYPDAELMRIVGSACELTGAGADELLKVIGRAILPDLASRVSDVVDRDGTAFEFLSTIDDVIHVEVRKLYPDAATPTVKTCTIDHRSIEVTYESSRNMWALAEGLIHGAGDLFGEPLTVTRHAEPNADGATVFNVELTAVE
jgi:hypothetical protein